MTFPCSDVGRTEKSKGRHRLRRRRRRVHGGEVEFGVERKEDEGQDKGKDGAGAGTDEHENARWILDLMPITVGGGSRVEMPRRVREGREEETKNRL